MIFSHLVVRFPYLTKCLIKGHPPHSTSGRPAAPHAIQVVWRASCHHTITRCANIATVAVMGWISGGEPFTIPVPTNQISNFHRLPCARRRSWSMRCFIYSSIVSSSTVYFVPSIVVVLLPLCQSFLFPLAVCENAASIPLLIVAATTRVPHI